MNAILIKCASKTRVTLLLAIIIIAVLIAPSATAQNSKLSGINKPDVLVLVLCGMEQSDTVSITFTDSVGENDIKSLIDTLKSITAWNITDLTTSTVTASMPSSVPSTSVNFKTNGIANYTNGTIPIEPFIIALKKYKVIHVNYLFLSGFNFKGLLDYSDDYVNIKQSSNQGSIVYKIDVLDNNFDKLNLPITPVNIQSTEKKSNTSIKITIIIILAFILAFITYLSAARLLSKKSGGEKSK